MQGHYPVAKEDAAQMCALQLAAEHASALVDDDAGMMMGIEKFITKQVGSGWGGWGAWGGRRDGVEK